MTTFAIGSNDLTYSEYKLSYMIDKALYIVKIITIIENETVINIG